LPSIIVDPSLSALAPAEAPQVHSDASNGQAAGNGAAPSVAGAEQGVASAESPEELRLSVAEADRFAASIRASWEPPEPVAAAAPIAPRSQSIAQPVSSSVIAQVADIPVARLPGSQRKRGLLLTLGAVVGFFALAALGLMSSKTGLPQTASAARSAESPKRAAPVAATGAAKPQRTPAPPAPIAAPAPAADPAPTDVPAPSAAPAPAAPTAPTAPPTPVPSAAPAPAAAPTPAPSTPAPTSAPAAALAGQPPKSVTDMNAVVAYAPADKAPSPATPSAAPAARALPAPAIAAVPDKPARRPATVHVRISAVPSQAALTLDGETIPNPFEADMVKGGKHRVQASAPGRRSADVTLKFDQNRVLELKLAEVRTAAAKSRRQRPTRANAPPRTPRPASSSPAADSTRGAGFVSESPY